MPSSRTLGGRTGHEIILGTISSVCMKMSNVHFFRPQNFSPGNFSFEAEHSQMYVQEHPSQGGS